MLEPIFGIVIAGIAVITIVVGIICSNVKEGVSFAGFFFGSLALLGFSLFFLVSCETKIGPSGVKTEEVRTTLSIYDERQHVLEMEKLKLSNMPIERK